MAFLEYLYKLSPHFLHNIFVTGFNILAYRKRYDSKYFEYLNLFKKREKLSRNELLLLQAQRHETFLKFANRHSDYYRVQFENIPEFYKIENIHKLPILSKEELRANINQICTIENKKDAIESKTGGTTGKSLKIYLTHDNIQERFAMLDNFRGWYGYKLGKRTAWFSGKNLLTERDIRKNRFWKTDLKYKVRYYSTFHIKEDYLKYYVENIIRFQPEYIVGFPSTIFEIAQYGLKHSYSFPKGICKAIFPTAESLSQEMRNNIEPFFDCKMYDQYASSEGAPFIFECEYGNLHLALQSGVYEVLDDNDKPTQSGRLVVTSFTTEGTPLIRYDIGDNISLEDTNKTCSCGNNNPLVKKILGRIDDFVYSPENGKINIVNIANAIKDVSGVIRYQIIQNELNKLIFNIVVDKSKYNKIEEARFLKNWRDRVGNKMKIDIRYVDDIPVEKSGKFRIVKNNIKDIIGNNY